MKINKKQQIITGVLMTTGMTLAMSGLFAVIHVGFTPKLPIIWATNLLVGWPVGFVVSTLIAGRVQRIAAWLASL